MGIQIDGSANTISGLAVGGLPNGSISSDDIASNAVTVAKLASTLDLSSNTVTLPNTSVTAGMLASTLDISGKTVTLPNTSVTAGMLASTLDLSSKTVTLPSGTGGKFVSYAILAHIEADGTNGGSSVGDTWTTRTINTTVADPDSIVTLSSNQFTLGAGSYLIEWTCETYASSLVTSRLYDDTNSTAIQNGIVSFGGVTYPSHAQSPGAARVTPSGSTAYEIQMNVNTSNAADGFGRDNPATGSGDEVFLFVKIYKEV